MLYLILVSSGFFIQQINGSPIPGAWVGGDGAWFGFTDNSGFYSFHGAEPDTVSVHATGFSDWIGPRPADGSVIHLHETVFNTGETILVTASRGSLAKTIPSTTQLTEDEIADLSTGGMGFLNGKVPGVSVREYGGSMPVVSVSIRGGDPSQVDHMVDGISIVSARDGMPTGIFDPAVFTSVEIARGGAASGGRGSGSTGAINYLPPLSSQPFSFSVSALSNGGAYFTGKYRGSAVSLRRNIGNEGTEGYSTTLLSTGSYGILRTGFLGAFASGSTEGPTWSQESDGHREQGQVHGWATLPVRYFEIDISGGAGLMDYRQSEPFSVDDSHSDFNLRTSILYRGPVTFQVRFNSAWLNSTATDHHSTQFATLHLTKTHGFLYANLGCRLDSDNKYHFSGRGTAEHQFGNRFSIHSSVFTDYRVPTVNDLYWPSDGYTSGNPELRSESTTGFETGGSWTGNSFSGGMCGFITGSDDLIIWLPDASGTWTPSNISSSVSKGLEFSSSFDMGSTVTSGTFTWNIATDETENTVREGMLLPYRPEYTWGVFSDIGMPLGFSIETSINGMGKRFTN
ncbi:MAG: TonB-dependent receptor plug domain-containing protein, partial [Candidatus Fermentibacteria bacterium]|nr:TonB-dependent receptor plug domain-containing protein [Candidatus Fermentibacteria bacterium]